MHAYEFRAENNSTEYDINVSFIFFLSAQQAPVGQGLLIHEVSRSHPTTHHMR